MCEDVKILLLEAFKALTGTEPLNWERQYLAQKMDDLDERAKLLGDLRDIKNLKASLHVKEQLIKDLNTELDDRSAKITALEIYARNLSTIITELESSNSGLEEACKYLRHHLSVKEQFIKDLNVELGIRDDRIKQLEANKAVPVALKSMAERDAKIKDLEGLVEIYHNQAKADVDNKLDLHNLFAKHQRGKLGESTVKVTVDWIKDLLSQVQLVQGQRDCANRSWTEQIAATRRLTDQLQDSRNSIKHLESTIKDQEASAQCLRSQVENLEAIIRMMENQS